MNKINAVCEVIYTGDHSKATGEDHFLRVRSKTVNRGGAHAPFRACSQLQHTRFADEDRYPPPQLHVLDR